MSHRSGHIIIDVALPHEEDEQERVHRMRKEPAISIKLEETCTEDDCAEMARLAYRRLRE